jgi:Zn-dependent M28 family amino/carboxypeptidase
MSRGFGVWALGFGPDFRERQQAIPMNEPMAHLRGHRIRFWHLLSVLCVLCGEIVALRAADPPRFDSSRAYEHVRQLVAIGPRPAGSPAIASARQYISAQIKQLGLRVVEQPFDAETPIGRVHMVNLLVIIPGAGKERLLIGGHYDTKLFRNARFVGANDGGSSAAFLLELARVLKDRKSPLTVELVFFDGEEAFNTDWVDPDNTYGSRYYVANAKRIGTLSDIRAMILVDMIGDRQLDIRRETASTPWLTDAIWASARKLKQTAFLNEPLRVEDDHMHFLEAGVPAVDIIDLDYAAWHTPADTLDQVSARSLQTVGDVLLDALPALEARLLQR